MTAAEVIRKLGEPSARRETGEPAFSIWRYEALGLDIGLSSVNAAGPQVDWVMQSKGSLVPALSIGTTREDVISMLGSFTSRKGPPRIQFQAADGGELSIVANDASVCAFTLSLPPGNPIKPEFKLGGITLFMNAAEVIKEIGRPDKVSAREASAFGRLWVYERLGMDVEVAPWETDQDVVIGVTLRKGSHSSGLSVGDPWPEAYRRFGDIRFRDGYDDTFEIVIDGGRVKAFTLQTPLSPY